MVNGESRTHTVPSTPAVRIYDAVRYDLALYDRHQSGGVWNDPDVNPLLNRPKTGICTCVHVCLCACRRDSSRLLRSRRRASPRSPPVHRRSSHADAGNNGRRCCDAPRIRLAAARAMVLATMQTDLFILAQITLYLCFSR